MSYTHHSDVINYLIQTKGYKSYLEIGVHVPAGNFDKIKCRFKIGVDPNGAASFTGTSDEFFGQNKQVFDIIFIDGLHHAEQVGQDFENAIVRLTPGGVILIHDTNPQEERFSVVPRVAKGRWNGDVFRVFQWFKDSENNYDYKTLNFDANGLTVVKDDSPPTGVPPPMTYSEFAARRAELTNLCTEEEFKAWI
jgi:hypothetical protein